MHRCVTVFVFQVQKKSCYTATGGSIVVVFWAFFTMQSYASAVLGIVILSVCLSVTRVLCDEMKEHTADILTPHKRMIILGF